MFTAVADYAAKGFLVHLCPMHGEKEVAGVQRECDEKHWSKDLDWVKKNMCLHL